MGTRYASIAFTQSVKAAQERYGTRATNLRHETDGVPGDVLTAREASFIREQDQFYQATVMQNGWPYVQFRGGPKGFLRVLDDRTLGYADFRGNIQYISAGNLAVDDRVALILVDYSAARRLKILGRASTFDRPDEPSLLSRLESPDYPGRVERGVVIHIEAFEWNCGQHITPRFSEEQLTTILNPLRQRIARLENELSLLRAGSGR